MSFDPFAFDDPAIFDVASAAAGPAGSLPFTAEMLRTRPSGDLFGWSQNAGMGWNPAALGAKEFLILSTHGGVRAPDGTPVALGYHTGHWEVGLLVEEAAKTLTASGATPFAAACTDPCDGRSQGTPAMFDSLPFRNDAAIVFGRLIRSLPTGRGVLGIATCDKGLPAMMMALAAARDLACVLVPGGVTLPPIEGEDAARIQSIGARFAHGELTLDVASELGCRTCASPGGGCQFLGTAATSQVVGEALGLSLGHTALAPSGQPIWLDMARRSALALTALERDRITTRRILTPAALRNAMVTHAAFGGSTNLLLHVPAIAHAAGLTRPTARDWSEINRQVPRLVDALPNGPRNHPTVQVFLAGGVPEVMLHLRRAGLLDTAVPTVSGLTLDQQLDAWENSERRQRLRRLLKDRDNVDPEDVIASPDRAHARGMTSTICFPHGNLAPEGSVIKSTAIDPSVVGADGVYRMTGPAKVFVTEADAIAAIKDGRIAAGDVLVLIGRGPMGAGMEETYQLTGALKYLSHGKHVAVVTDARFSGVSTGACIGHVSPEALAGGPIGKLRDGDPIAIVIDRLTLTGSIDYAGPDDLARRDTNPDVRPDPRLPEHTRLWAALQSVSGGAWGGAVYDADAILKTLDAGRRQLEASSRKPEAGSRPPEADSWKPIAAPRRPDADRRPAANGSLKRQMKAELLVDARCELGEGPVWDAARGALWWTDIDGRAIWRFDPVPRRTDRFTPPDRVGFLAVAAGGRLILGCAKALYLAEVGERSLETTKLVDVEPDLRTTRVNDGRTDRFGNIVFGTLDEQRPRRPIASFYQYSSAHGLRRFDLPNCRVSNSICFSPDGVTMYFADTPTGVIRCGDYDAEAATVVNVREFATLHAEDGHPDGSIVDAEGCVWNAAWGGAVVRRFLPDGHLDRAAEIPTKNPTCPAFGDVDLGTMYVTSSRQQHTAEELEATPAAGGVYAVRIPGIRGIAETPFA